MRKPYTRRAGLVHVFALDRNELRRWSDRIEAWFLLALIIAFVPLAAIAAVSAVRWVHADGTRELDADLRLSRVSAVLERDAAAEQTPSTVSVLLLVPARWMADGVPHTGDIPAIPGTPAGTSVPIWVNAAGNVVQQPLTSSQLSAHVILAATVAPLAVAVGMLLAWCGLRWVLDRRRLAAWDKSWSMVGPSWTRWPR